jgi:hypothetical protein
LGKIWGRDAIYLDNIEFSRTIDQLDDRLLEAAHAMLGTSVQKEVDPVVGYEADGTPITASTLEQQADEAVTQIERGEYTTWEELEKESEQWLYQSR